MSTCLVSNLTTQKQTLTGGPSLPGRPCTPFFPWGPCWMKVRKLTLSFSNKGGKTQEQVFHLLSRHPDQPLWTRKTLQERQNDCFLSVSLPFLKCIKHVVNIFGSLFVHTRIPVLPCCPGAPISPGEPWFKQEMMAWEVSGPQATVYYHQSTHYVSLWALDPINSPNTLWGKNTSQLTVQSKPYVSADALVLAPSQREMWLRWWHSGSDVDFFVSFFCFLKTKLNNMFSSTVVWMKKTGPWNLKQNAVRLLTWVQRHPEATMGLLLLPCSQSAFTV